MRSIPTAPGARPEQPSGSSTCSRARASARPSSSRADGPRRIPEPPVASRTKVIWSAITRTITRGCRCSWTAGSGRMWTRPAERSSKRPAGIRGRGSGVRGERVRTILACSPRSPQPGTGTSGGTWRSRTGNPHGRRRRSRPMRSRGSDATATGPLADLGVFCLSGADLPVDDRRIVRWLRRHSLAAEDLVRNDSFAVLRAGTERSWGVGVVCGFGTNCSGVAPNGRVTRFPAIGPVSGDFGGGIELGTLSLWHAIRAEDGRGDPTLLRTLVPTHFGMRRPSQVMEALYRGTLGEHRLTELTPVLFRAARRNDRIAREVVCRQADEIVAMATVAIRRLRMQRLDVDVVLGGGVFQSGWQPFLERIEAGVRAFAPDARVLVLDAPPVVGAALIGLDHLGARGAAQRRVRAGLTHEA